MILRGRLVSIVLLASFTWAVRGADEGETVSAAWLAEHYTKYEHRITMRDGIRLHTSVLVPKDDSQAWPILLTRTPYDVRPYGSDRFPNLEGSAAMFARDRFILVSQDVRGRNGSEGEFDEMRPYTGPSRREGVADESTDAWDTIDWLVKHVPGNNGRVGVFGVSYPGFYTSMAMIDSHPALAAASPQAPIADLFLGDDVFHNGAFFLAANFGFSAYFDQKLEDPTREEPRDFDFRTPDGYDFFLRLGPLANADRLYFKERMPTWSESQEHSTYDDFWKARNIRPHLRKIRCPVMTVGGWYDGEDLSGTLETYRWTERQNPGLTNLLVMGPWVHGGWSQGAGDKLGAVQFHSKTAEFYRREMELPFFRHFLKNDTHFTAVEARLFETGTFRWRSFSAWPPPDATPRRLYLRPRASLSWDPPAEDVEAFDTYDSDPARPVPHTTRISTGYSPGYMVEDQRFAASRPDVLVYQTDPLDVDLTVGGPIRARLEVSTTGTDSDFVVKLIDVYPGDFPDPDPNPSNLRMGGYQQLVRGEPFRGKYRNSFEHPEPFEPGQVTTIDYTLPDVLHTFRRGHRLMIQIQSSWFPLVDRNPQKFVNIPKATAADFRRATQRVHRSTEHPTFIELSVLDR